MVLTTPEPVDLGDGDWRVVVFTVAGDFREYELYRRRGVDEVYDRGIVKLR
jgi:hypothetical protein